MNPVSCRAVLTMAHYSGTLAAARCLADANVAVDMVSSRRLAPAAWSRSATRTFSGPTMENPEETLRWLLAFGRARPGAVLHPTSDDLAWLIARHADELSECYRLYTAPFSAVRGVLDKRRLYEAAHAVGLETPRTWFPAEESEVARLASNHELLVVKPRSQTYFEKRFKGELVRGPAHAVKAFCTHRDAPYASIVSAESPGIQFPMLQEYVPAASTSVYSISGFADRQGRIHGARAACKVLQRPQLGVGLCFVAAEVEAEVVSGLERLCAETGYYGVFEAEFIPDGSRRLLIDFNPRYYGQMGFDVARGVPLAWMIHLGATGREDAIPTAVNDASTTGARAYHDSLTLRWLLALGRLAGGVKSHEAQTWTRWLDEHRDVSVDACIRRDDVMPALASAAGMMLRTVRNPRSSFRAVRPKA